MKQFDIEQVLSIKHNSKEILQHLRANKNWGIDTDTDWRFFINAMSLLPPQSYGCRIQNKLVNEFRLTSMNKNISNGDFRDNFGNPYECKATLITHNKSNLNFVQIRPFHNCNYYLTAFDIIDPDIFKVYIFSINKREMLYELNDKKLGACAHGNVKNKTTEYRISLKYDLNDPHFNRWCENYLQTDMPLYKKYMTEIN
jgi:hypothetical protein